MSQFKCVVHFNAKVRGTYETKIEAEDKDAAKESAEQDSTNDIEQEIMNNGGGDVNIDDCDVSVEDVKFKACPECNGRKYKISTLEAGAGLLKVGPCPACQRIPNTEEVCKHVMTLLDDLAEENMEEDE